MADKGEAMSDGSYPIANVADLENAIQSFGRAKDKAGTKAHIITRAKALGASDKLPADWTTKVAKDALTDAGDGIITAGDLTGDPVDKGKDSQMSDELKKVADLEKAVAELTKSNAEIVKRAEKAEADLVKANSLTPAEQNFASGLNAGDKAKFMASEADERKTQMSKAAEADAEVYKSADGQVFRKSDDPRLVAMAKRADESEKLAKAERDAREMGEFTKRAETELTQLPGEVVAKAKVLKAIAKMSDEDKAVLDTMLKAGRDAIAKGFQKFGVVNGGIDGDNPEAKLQTLAKAKAAKDGTSYEKAYSAVLDTDEGKQLYADSKESRKSA
jgi:hypothetical protein